MRFSRDQQNSLSSLRAFLLRNPAFVSLVSGLALLMVGYGTYLPSMPNQGLLERKDGLPLRQEKDVAPKEENLRNYRSGHKQSSKVLKGDSKWAAEVKEEERRRNILLTKPHRWHTFNYWDLHAYFSCTLEFGNGRPLYNSTQWMRLRDYYNHFALRDATEEAAVQDGQMNRTFKYSDEVFDPPVEGFHSSSKLKGRSIRAKRNIALGEVVNKNCNNTVIFSNGHTFRKFLFGIYERRSEFDAGTACDVLKWSWIQKLENAQDVKPLVIFSPLDVSGLTNDGQDENMDCGVGDEDIAKRDIAKGEEITCHYLDFASPASWPQLGL